MALTPGSRGLVEEPVLDAMDFNEFELEADWEALDQDIAENMAAD